MTIPFVRWGFSDPHHGGGRLSPGLPMGEGVLNRPIRRAAAWGFTAWQAVLP
ncbi:hypothetical protein JMJ55_15090 [Belnapia sp. T6]|uniref:Uncharacterized protein n=1 Tax=Belnapia mucosa TaxID=2804532 RepID=A0ABS1V4N9_9PROT|nr:hypothetical protein [Belnapia mucosa]MBL6456659.1 hypothetical protein [Belnapia mucosa]